MKTTYGLAVILGSLFLWGVVLHMPTQTPHKSRSFVQKTTPDHYISFSIARGDAEDDGADDETDLVPVFFELSGIPVHRNRIAQASSLEIVFFGPARPLYLLVREFRI